MKKNYSPWLHQLHKDRETVGIHTDIETDVAIIGAGIAGVSTAFFILKNTQKKIALLEGYKLAHGATGHNAGQIVSYFERGFASLVDEFGLDLATYGQKSVEDAWQLLNEMYTESGLDIPFSRFLGHAGLSSSAQVLLHLKNNFWRKKGGLITEQIRISKTAGFLHEIPKEYKSLYSLVSHEEILETLETKMTDFVAVISFPKGCINSALFCEEVVLALQKKYPDRFTIYEHTQISKIILRHEHAILDAERHTINSEHVVLCTNGFSSVTIINETGLDINTKYHHLINGQIGYMSGYLEMMNKPPIAISYLTDPDPNTKDPYFYLTRRPYEYEKGQKHNLISIGGPEASYEDSVNYIRDSDFPDQKTQMIDEFIHKNYGLEPQKKIDYIFTWHGLMGYTKNGVRLIGPEPKNPVLLYNLGCNGIGILPSIYGGKRIADYLRHGKVPKSIFDVPEQYQ